MARLFTDENFPFPVVEALRRMGHDVVTIADAGKDLDFDGQAARISHAIETQSSLFGLLIRVNRPPA